MTRHDKNISGDISSPAMSGAARTKAYRERLRAGRSIFMIDADDVDLAFALKAEGFLKVVEPTHDDINAALQRVVDTWIEDRK